MATNQEALEHHVAEARAIVAEAEKEKRKLTKAEVRQVEEHIDRVKAFKAMIADQAEAEKTQVGDSAELQAQIDRLKRRPRENVG